MIDTAKELTGGANRGKDGVSFVFLGANFDGESILRMEMREPMPTWRSV